MILSFITDSQNLESYSNVQRISNRIIAARTSTPPLSCQAAVKRTHWPRQHATPPPTPAPSRKRKAEVSTDITTPEASPFSRLSRRVPRTPVSRSRTSKMLTPMSGTRYQDQKFGVKRRRLAKDGSDECDGGLWEEPRIRRRKKMKVTPILIEESE